MGNFFSKNIKKFYSDTNNVSNNIDKETSRCEQKNVSNKLSSFSKVDSQYNSRLGNLYSGSGLEKDYHQGMIDGH